MRRPVTIAVAVAGSLAGVMFLVSLLAVGPVVAGKGRSVAISTAPVKGQPAVAAPVSRPDVAWSHGAVPGVPQTASAAPPPDLLPGRRPVMPAATGLVPGAPFNPGLNFARANAFHDFVDGQFGPTTTVYITVTDALGALKGAGSGTSGASGWMSGVWAGADIVAGDWIHVRSEAGFTATMQMITITGQVDADLDRVTGTMSGGVFPADGSVELPPPVGTGVPISITAGGHYTADFGSQYDIISGTEAWPWYVDPAGNHLGTALFAPYLSLATNYARNWVRGGTLPDAAVAITLSDGSGVVKATASVVASQYGGFGPDCGDWSTGDCPDIEAGDRITATAIGLVATISPIGTIDAELDPGANTVSGTIQAGWFAGALDVLCMVWVENGPPGIWTTADANGGSYLCDFDDVGWDLEPGQTVAVYYQEPDGDWVGNVFEWPWARVNYAHDWVGGDYEAGHRFWLTVTDGLGAVKATATITTTGDGGWGGPGFEIEPWQWVPEQPDIVPGDWTLLAADDGYTNALQVGLISGALDAAADSAAGQVFAGWFTDLLDVECHPWGAWNAGIPDAPVKASQADPDGSTPFLCQWDPATEWDMQPGQDVAVMYVEPDGDRIIEVLDWPSLRVNYGHDHVGGNYDAGHTILITVTDGLGAVKATALVNSTPQGGWGGPGFETEPWHWIPTQPDIEPGDWTMFAADDGYTHALQVGHISATLDVDTDSVSGQLFADWFTDSLRVECHPWGAWNAGIHDAPVKDSEAAPDGSTSFLCEWDPTTEWDIQPGQDVGVFYAEPDGDLVNDVYREPGPELWIYKEARAEEVNPGGLVIYRLDVGNDGDGPAQDVTIRDSLPADTAYVFDTSPYPVITSTDAFTLQVGTVEPWSFERIFVTLRVDPSVPISSTLARNAVEINSSSYENDTDNNWFEVEQDVHVTDAQPDLYVDKWSNPGDPSPGETFVYQINVGNMGPVVAGPTWLTDSLPAGTSFVSWSADNIPALWTEVMTTGGEFVLYAPALPAHYGDQLSLRLRLSEAVTYGTRLSNTMVITTDGDADPGNNMVYHDDTWVGPPRWDLEVHKNFGHGVLAPGGQINYHIGFWNGSNATTHDVWLTDTLPAGTRFVGAFIDTPFGSEPVTPTLSGPDWVAWNLGTLEPAESGNFRLELSIDSDTPPGTVLTNTVTIASTDLDSWPYNNAAQVVETVNPPGANLRLRKEAWWDGAERLGYWIEIQNVGTAVIHDPTITDTYPISTTFGGEWWADFWEAIDLVEDPGNRHLIWTLARLEPGWSTGVGYYLDLDGDIVGVPGLSFSNDAIITVAPGEVTPEDNLATAFKGSGPDIYVDKWLSGGTPEAGAIVTFTIEFGNRNNWPWNTGPDSEITDTLPPEMTFITATAPWDPGDHWMPTIMPGNVLSWTWGHVWPNSSWLFEVAVQITDTVVSGDVLTNSVAMMSLHPEDVEANYSDNQVDLAVPIVAPFRLYLPLAIKPN